MGGACVVTAEAPLQPTPEPSGAGANSRHEMQAAWDCVRRLVLAP
jgi:hypothetical protein